MRRFAALLLIAVLPLACAQMSASQQSNGGRMAEAKDMALVSFNDLQTRSAYQPAIHRQGDRFIAYAGHHGGAAHSIANFPL